MLRKKIKIQNKLGLHARPARHVVETASRFDSMIYLSRRGERVDAKSIMGILMLEARYGTEVDLIIEGDDEAEAMEALSAVFDQLATDKQWNTI